MESGRPRGSAGRIKSDLFGGLDRRRRGGFEAVEVGFEDGDGWNGRAGSLVGVGEEFGEFNKLGICGSVKMADELLAGGAFEDGG